MFANTYINEFRKSGYRCNYRPKVGFARPRVGFARQKYYPFVFTTLSKIVGEKKDTATNVPEIGILDGESIKLWNDFFVNATVYGLDVTHIDTI